MLQQVTYGLRIDIRQVAGQHQPARIGEFIHGRQNAGDRTQVLVTIDDLRVTVAQRILAL
jgi:hypothetical protein